jgi:hypothetical protein
MDSFRPTVIVAQVFQVVGQAVGYRNAPRIAVPELGRVLGRYVTRKGFLSL